MWPSNPHDEVLALIEREVERQNTTIQLIASENFTSPAVLRATGSVMAAGVESGRGGTADAGAGWAGWGMVSAPVGCWASAPAT